MVIGLVRDAALDAFALLIPTECAGCGVPDRTVCPACRAAVEPHVRTVTLNDGLGNLTAWHPLDYGGPVARMLVALKDGGRTGAARVFAPALSAAVTAALAAAGPGSPVEFAAVPSSRAAFRRRGYHHVPLLLAAAGYRSAPVLVGTRATADQAALGVRARAANRSGSMRARRAAGRVFLVVDDILTTGATVLEARRAIVAAGGSVAAVVAVAHTPRAVGPSGGTPSPVSSGGGPDDTVRTS